MPRLRAANSVSTDELIQLVTCMKTENNFPKAERGKARGELDAAVECLKQFSATTIYNTLVKAIAALTDGEEDPISFVVRKRIEMLGQEKGDSCKLMVLKWIEDIIRACATSHVMVQQRLDIRKPSGSVGNSLDSGSPYADAMRRRKPAADSGQPAE